MTGVADFGALLAGGAGSRFGGLDKATIALGGAPLWQWAWKRLAAQARTMVAIAPRQPAWIAIAPAGQWIPDAPPGGTDPPWGPAGAILAALEHALHEQGPGALVLSCPVDSPFLPLDLFEHLNAALAAKPAPAAIAAQFGRPEAVFGLWRAVCAKDLRKLLEEQGSIALHRAASALGAARVAAWEQTADEPFFNINNAEGLAEAERIVISGEIDPP